MPYIQPQKNNQSGLSLIEIMIVIGIMGILISSTIPSFKKYITKAKFLEISRSVEPLKSQVSECLQIYGKNYDCSQNVTNYNKRIISKITVNKDGVINLSPENNGNIKRTDTYILKPELTPHGVIWHKSGTSTEKGYA